ncbi:MAG: heavy-metal-associated domain-containing protein [Flavobacteriales bacterium]|tara:strand:+ start:1232 stop:1951 length:720 start_codon:yes stop_codon:yes gene_type:complete
MKQTYIIDGMTCGGCKASVEKHLLDLKEISEVEITLKNKEVVITMGNPIEASELQKALPSKYKVSLIENNFVSKALSNSEDEKSKLQQLKPLILILFYITTASVLLNYQNWDRNEIMLDFMGLFYIVFSFFKLLDLKGFSESFKMYDPLASRISIYGWMYPFIEVVLGLMFLMHFGVKTALVITLIVLGITTIGVAKSLLDKKSIRCACLGTALKLPMTEATFIENAVMIVMAILLLVS